MKLSYNRGLVIIGTLFFLVQSCESNVAHNQTQLNTQDSLYQVIMDIHDEVMPLTSKIVQKKDLLEKLSSNDSLAQTKIQELGAAEEAMWDWMYQIKAPKTLRDSLNPEQLDEYLKEQLKQIRIVKDQMLKANDNNE